MTFVVLNEGRRNVHLIGGYIANALLTRKMLLVKLAKHLIQITSNAIEAFQPTF